MPSHIEILLAVFLGVSSFAMTALAILIIKEMFKG